MEISFLIPNLGFLTLRDFDCTIRPLLSPAAEQAFARMMQQLQDKKKIPPEEIEFESSAVKDPQTGKLPAGQPWIWYHRVNPRK